MGVSRGGYRAQLEIHSTGLNLRSDNGLWRPIVALGKGMSLGALSWKYARLNKERLTRVLTSALET